MAQKTELSNSALPGAAHTFSAKTAAPVVDLPGHGTFSWEYANNGTFSWEYANDGVFSWEYVNQGVFSYDDT